MTRSMGAGMVVHPLDGHIRLHAGGEVMTASLSHDVHISGLAGGRPKVTFKQYLLTTGLPRPSVLGFLRRHDRVEVEFTLDLTDYGPLDRRLLVVGCHLVDLALVEAEVGTAVQFMLAGERLEGDLLAMLDPAPDHR